MKSVMKSLALLLAVSAGWGLYVALAGAIVALFALAGEYVDS